MTFSHLLSKVKFTVTSDAVNGYSHKVTNITVANFSEGTFTLGATPAAGTWGSTTDEVVNLAAIEGVESTDATGVANDAILLIPNEAAFNVSFDVELNKGTTKLSTKSCPTNSVTTKLEAGKSYNIIIKVKGPKDIQIEAALTDWVDGGDYEYDSDIRPGGAQTPVTPSTSNSKLSLL